MKEKNRVYNMNLLLRNVRRFPHAIMYSNASF